MRQAPVSLAAACVLTALLAPAQSRAAVTCTPSVTLVDKGPGLVDLPVGSGTMKVISLDVVYDTGCQGATGSGYNYTMYGPPSSSAEWSGIHNNGGTNLSGTDHYDKDPGRAYVVELHASCCTKCGGLGVESKSVTIKSNVVVAPAWIGGAMYLGTSQLYQCFPTGTKVQFLPNFTGKADGSERWRLRLKGAGLDYDQTFSHDELSNPIYITAPGSGEVDFWIVHEPYGVESANHLTLRAEPDGCVGGEKADAGTKAAADAGAEPDPDDTTPQKSGLGCSAAGTSAALMGLVALVAPALRGRRRR